MTLLKYYIRFVLFIVLSLVFSFHLYATDNAGPILIISSYNPDTRNTTANISEFMEEYKRGGGISPVVIENMNCKSLPEAPLWDGKMRGILDKYKENNTPQLIIILGQEAWASYISQEYKPDIPVLCGMISKNAILLPDSDLNVAEWEPKYIDIQEYVDKGLHLGGFLYSYDVKENIRLIHKLYPKTQNIALITDNTYGGLAMQTLVKKEMENIKDLNLILLDGRKNNIYTIVEQIKNLPDQTVILIGTWRVDVNDGYYVGNATYTMMTANPRIPTFTLASVGIGHWAIGGFSPKYRPIGSDLAKEALSILEKKIAPKDIHPQIIPNGYVFDASKIKAFDISRLSLPHDATIINEDPSLFSKYRFEILLSVITVLFIFLIMILIFFIRTNKLKDKLLDLQKDNILIMNNIQASIYFIKPDYTVKWRNEVEFHDCIPEFGPANCFLVKNGVKPYCTRCTVAKAMETKKQVDITNEFGDGKYLHILANPVLDEHNNLIGVIFKKEDVTKQKQAENELRKAKEKAEESDRLKSAFLANMSHEIRTPLNAIVGFSNIIAEIDDEVERQSYLDIIHKNNDLLLQLIDDILDFSKIEAGTMDYHFEEVDIKDICGEIALADSIKMPSDVVLIFDLGSPSVIVKTDERRVMQVISNFVNNAIKFTTKGSITIYYEIEGDFIRVCVKDTGIGISAENQRRIFERFIKVDTFQQGTGLGLTISRTIIEALGGKIGVDSEEGVGSTFWFTLPLDTKRTDIELSPDIPVQSEETPRSDRHHSILIAEDVYENYFLLETLFGKQYQLYHALNGQEAIDMFETYHPDLILMDIKMPVMDGFEATRRIRTLSKTIPIIALTAFAFEREKEIAKQCEFTDYVVKPIDIKELKKLIVKVLA